MSMIGHNSVQVPHDGKAQFHKGANFKKVRFSTFFRPTGVSVALRDAGIIPDVHLVQDARNTGVLRHKRDKDNAERSVRVSF